MADEPVKIAGTIPLSTELLADSLVTASAIHAALKAPRPTPEERAARRARQRAERIAERLSTPTAPVTVERLRERMGWSDAYAHHLVQPYCRCGAYGPDGEWEVCEHAYDLGVTS